MTREAHHHGSETELEKEAETVKEVSEKAAEAETEQQSQEDGQTAQDAKSREAGSPGEEPSDTEAETEEVKEDEKPDASGSERKEKKGFFKKKKDKRDEQIEELRDRVQRQMAEFDNFRKRTDKEKASMYEVGAKSVIEKILPVVDSFERGLAGIDENCGDAFVIGMEKIYKQLMATLDTLDVKPIEAKGKQFNPDLHNAVLHVEDDQAGENEVVEELQKGYTYRGNVVRHSMVKVAN